MNIDEIKDIEESKKRDEETQRIIDFLNTITPVDTGDGKTSVECLEEARRMRAEQLSNT